MTAAITRSLSILASSRGGPQALELFPEVRDRSGLFGQLFLIGIDDFLAIAVEDSEMEHMIHVGHDDQILTLGRDVVDATYGGH